MQLLIVLLRRSTCGEVLGGVRPLPDEGVCGRGSRLLREMDWVAARQALGWP